MRGQPHKKQFNGQFQQNAHRPLPGECSSSRLIVKAPVHCVGPLDRAKFKNAPGCRDGAPLSENQSGSGLPEWIVGLATLQHRACLAVDDLVNGGSTQTKAIAIIARRFNGRTLKSRPKYRVQLSAKSLWRLHDKWRHGGQIPAALYRRYVSPCRYVDAPLLVRFVNLAANREWPSFKACLQVFVRRGGNFGSGRRNRHKLKIKADTLRRQLPKGCYRKLQALWKTISRAQREIASLKFQTIAQIRARVPAKTSRQRKGLNFEI